MESLRNLPLGPGGRSLGTERSSAPTRQDSDFGQRLDSLRDARRDSRRGAEARDERSLERERRVEDARTPASRTRQRAEPERADEPTPAAEPETNEEQALAPAAATAAELAARPAPARVPQAPERTQPTAGSPGPPPAAAAGLEPTPASPAAPAAPAAPTAPTAAAAAEPATPAAPAAPESAAPAARVDGAGSEATLQLERESAPARAALEAPERALRQTAAEVLEQVRVVLRPGMRHADVQLNPAELGRVSIRLALKGARVDAVARVESIEALAALERHLPELRAAFAERGIELGELDLQYTGDSPDTRDEARREAGRAVRFQRTAVQAGASSDPEPIRRRPDVATEDAVDTLA